MDKVKKYMLPIIMFIIFESIAVTLWIALNDKFYLFNFTYIGSFLTLAFFLYIKKYKYARLVAQLGVGTYLLVYVGLILRENMNIEGFFYFLFLGIFQGAVIHYIVAKIFGPFLFGRGWCGYSCWTAMILDLLPYKTTREPRKKYGYIRYIVFIVSLIYVSSLLILKIPDIDKIMYWTFIIGTIIYYFIGILLAFKFKDNRAFCKYICPATVFLKPASYFSCLRVQCDKDKCVSCGRCKRECPMNVDMTDNSRKRKNGTECILCFRCKDVCPKKAIYIKIGKY